MAPLKSLHTRKLAPQKLRVVIVAAGRRFNVMGRQIDAIVN
jgi:hypothetical protein